MGRDPLRSHLLTTLDPIFRGSREREGSVSKTGRRTLRGHPYMNNYEGSSRGKGRDGVKE